MKDTYIGMPLFTVSSQNSLRYLAENDDGDLIWAYPNHEIPSKVFNAQEFEDALKKYPYLQDSLFSFWPVIKGKRK
jgi:hypothetical protein